MKELWLENMFEIDEKYVYRSFIGDIDHTKQVFLDEKHKEVKSLIGEDVILNGHKRRVINAQVSRRCNLVNSNYYIEILAS